MTDILLTLGLVLAGAGLVLFILVIVSTAARKLFGVAFTLLLGIVLLLAAAIAGTITLATQGYRALTHEEVAAFVTTQPLGPQSFVANFRFPDGRLASYSLTGDQLYVDAHILKWKPIVNILGLHTAYEFDRVGGRYIRLEDEQQRPRTIFALSQQKPLDLFELRKRYGWLSRLVDAEYGSGSFIAATEPANYEIRVSTTGLLIRKVQ